MSQKDDTQRHSLTDLILIEQSESDSEAQSYEFIVPNGSNFQSEQDFQKEIDRLKAASTKKFKDKWEEILHKYATIDDAVESDEIDLATGTITKDNGHIKALTTSNATFIKQNVWSSDYDGERDRKNGQRREKLRQQRKLELKTQLKAQQEFYIANSKVPKAPIRKVSPDNILLLDPSPTKKQKISPTKTDDTPQFTLDNGSPLRHFSDSEDLLTELELPPTSTPTKYDLVTRLFDTHPVPVLSDKFITPVHDINNSDIEDSIEYSSTSESDLDPFIDGIPRFPISNEEVLNPSDPKGEVSSDDSDYLIVEEHHLFITSTKTQILSCCFEECYYTTGNKLLFKRHLLEKHRSELFIIGYPISENEIDTTKDYKITAEMVDHMESNFPLVHEVPPLPLSHTLEMFKCKLSIHDGKKTCKREFLSANELHHHQGNYPFKCSSKSQVYVCPLLGCGFMTDEGYFKWRDHFIENNHHIKPVPQGEIIGSVVMPIGHSVEIPETVEDETEVISDETGGESEDETEDEIEDATADEIADDTADETPNETVHETPEHSYLVHLVTPIKLVDHIDRKPHQSTEPLLMASFSEKAPAPTRESLLQEIEDFFNSDSDN